MDRLAGDQWGVDDWLNAKKEQRPDSRPFSLSLPEEIQETVQKLQELCAQHSIPNFQSFSLPSGMKTLSDMQDKPENCNHAFLLARANASGNPSYIQAIVMNPAFMMLIPRNI